MGLNLVQKIIKNHLIEGKMIQGETISVKADQTLVHDGTGMLAFLEFEALGVPKIKTETSVCYIDHGLLQGDFKNADDHKFLQTASSKYGAYFSRPGNGICHQVHLERFAVPGKILLGADSHTSTAGGVGMLAIGLGGLNIALAMAGVPFSFQMPKVVNIILKGQLKPYVSAKDVILILLKKLSVKGGLNKIFEFSGPGVKNLSVTERATITNMGTELGATTSIFPSDENVFQFLKYQNRERDWVEIKADADAQYGEKIEINLEELEPMIAQPHMPDNVVKVSKLSGKPVDQIAIGSCTNSSITDLLKVASILKDKKVHPDIEVALNAGSRQVLKQITQMGVLNTFISAGIRILEVGCGPCIGMGFAPPTKGVSLRTFNRNFYGRSGTKDAEVYLVSPEVAAASAITGKITDPRGLNLEPIQLSVIEKNYIDDSMIIPPSIEPDKIEVKKGPNISDLPLQETLESSIEASIQLKLGDNITTDDIVPGGAKVLPLRSNLPASAEYTFIAIDPDFKDRMKKIRKGIIIAGHNYGQGSSREMAAFVCMYLGVKAVIAKSFSRIHRSNLINCGIPPLLFKNESDYDKMHQDDLLIVNINDFTEKSIKAKNTNGVTFLLTHDLEENEKLILKAGGALSYYRKILNRES